MFGLLAITTLNSLSQYKNLHGFPRYASHDMTDPNGAPITPQLHPQAVASAYQLVQLQRQWVWCQLLSASRSADKSLQFLPAGRNESEQFVELQPDLHLA